MTRISASRRALLSGSVRAGRLPTRPPWAIAPGQFEERCTRCGACVDACPESILHRGDGGFPRVDFSAGACTFCAACVRACEPAALYRDSDTVPWQLRIAIDDACLARRGVECRICGERCESAAIRFRLRLGGPALAETDRERCTGCGACVASCPVGAITMQVPR